LSAYLRELRAEVEARRIKEQALREQQAAAAAVAARAKLAPLDARLARLIAAIPSEVLSEGVSLLSLQAQLRARGHGHHHCHVGELGEALRRLGFRRERRWRNETGFRALWYPKADQ
jgi:hypothetical protein